MFSPFFAAGGSLAHMFLSVPPGESAIDTLHLNSLICHGFLIAFSPKGDVMCFLSKYVYRQLKYSQLALYCVCVSPTSLWFPIEIFWAPTSLSDKAGEKRIGRTRRFEILRGEREAVRERKVKRERGRERMQAFSELPGAWSSGNAETLAYAERDFSHVIEITDAFY
jgi:hypothetical protein